MKRRNFLASVAGLLALRGASTATTAPPIVDPWNQTMTLGSIAIPRQTIVSLPEGWTIARLSEYGTFVAHGGPTL